MKLLWIALVFSLVSNICFADISLSHWKNLDARMNGRAVVNKPSLVFTRGSTLKRIARKSQEVEIQPMPVKSPRVVSKYIRQPVGMGILGAFFGATIFLYTDHKLAFKPFLKYSAMGALIGAAIATSACVLNLAE